MYNIQYMYVSIDILTENEFYLYVVSDSYNFIIQLLITTLHFYTLCSICTQFVVAASKYK